MAAEPQSRFDSPASLDRGATIGRYVVLALVGRGSMGEVYAAYDPELDRKVAVKLLRSSSSDEATNLEAKSRLLREAQAIAKLSHPNVVVVHDVGSFGNRVFLAMEYVDGHTVRYWRVSENRTWREILRVFLQAGQGLAAAHASHIVHRDFKGDNVMVASNGQVRVMDFGLARRLPNPLVETSGAVKLPPLSLGTTPPPRKVQPTGEIDLDATTPLSGPGSLSLTPVEPTGELANDITQSGTVLGTPAYMAPEQFDGHAADPRSDQFSFCVALYEALYAELPFAGTHVRELWDNVRRGRVRAPKDPSRVPSWLRKVLLRGMRSDPTERWPSMAALLHALQQDPAVAWRRRATTFGALALVATIGAIARHQGARDNQPHCNVGPERFAGVWEPSPVAGSRRRTIAERFRLSGQPYAFDTWAGAARLLDSYVRDWTATYTDTCEATNVRGEQSAEVLDLRMSCLHERWNELRALSDVFANPDAEVVTNAVKATLALTPLEGCSDTRSLRAAVAPPRDLALRRQVEGLRMRLASAKAMEDAGRFGQALELAAGVVADARRVSYQPVLAEALTRLGGIQTHMGRASDAEATLDEAIWTAEATRNDEIVAIASADQIFVVGYQLGDLARARRWLRQTEAFLTRIEGHDLLRAWMHNNFGTALDAHGELDEATNRYRTALQIKERVLGSSHPDLGASLTNLALTLDSLGRSEEALTYSNRGVDIVARALGSEHPDTAQQLTNRADILNHLGRFAEARVDAERAVAIWKREMGEESPGLVFFLEALGEALLGLEQPDDAGQPLGRALDLAEAHGITNELRPLRFALARALWASGRDRTRALALGAAAASSPDGQNGGTTSELSKEEQQVQARAVAWLEARKVQSGPRRAGKRVVTR